MSTRFHETVYKRQRRHRSIETDTQSLDVFAQEMGATLAVMFEDGRTSEEELTDWLDAALDLARYRWGGAPVVNQSGLANPRAVLIYEAQGDLVRRLDRRRGAR
jgi:hypothetical protein